MTIYDRLISQENLFPKLGSAYKESYDTGMNTFTKRISDLAQLERHKQDAERQKGYLDIQKQYANAEREMRPTKEKIAEQEFELSKLKVEELQKELNPAAHPEYHQRKSFNTIVRSLFNSGEPEEKALGIKWMGRLNQKQTLEQSDYDELEQDFASVQKQKSDKNYEMILRQAASKPTTEFSRFIQSGEVTIPEDVKMGLINLNRSAVDTELKKLQTKRSRLLDDQAFLGTIPAEARTAFIIQKGNPASQLKEVDEQIFELKTAYPTEINETEALEMIRDTKKKARNNALTKRNMTEEGFEKLKDEEKREIDDEINEELTKLHRILKSHYRVIK